MEYVTDEEVKELKEKCLTSLRNAIWFKYHDSQGYYREADAAEMYQTSVDFMSKFIDEEENYVPTMKTAMRIISDSGIGAAALGFIDEVDTTGVTIADCIESSDYTVLDLANLFDANATQTNRLLDYSFYLNQPVTLVMEFTRRINISVQQMFDHQFYGLCDKFCEV